MHANRIAAFLLFVCAMLVTLTACATPEGATRGSSHALRIVNATFDGVTALAMAPSGSSDFHDLALAQPLPGGLASAMVDVPPGACRRDVRVTFHGDRTLLYRHFDVCRSDGLRLAVGSTRSGRSTVLKSENDVDVADSP
jgi:hypothetical protein